MQGPQKMMDNLPKLRPVNVELATLNPEWRAYSHLWTGENGTHNGEKQHT